MPTPKYHRTPQGHTYGTRYQLFRLLYIPRKGDKDVIEFLLMMRAKKINITQLLTDAIRIYKEQVK